MDQMANYIWIIPAAPLLGFMINAGVSFFYGADAPAGLKKLSALLSPAVILVSFFIGLGIFLEMLGHGESERAVSQNLYTWIKAGTLEANATLYLDQLSIVFVLIITGVGFLIHLYSTGYMDHDRSMIRYFAYLNLFTFAMLILVMADNILLLFVGWEGVGLCSYLLIGFWFAVPKYASAGMKAFIVNRIGDFGFIIGFFMLFWGVFHYSGTTNIAFDSLKSVVGSLPGWYLTTISLLFFFGATGKSAQIPLYVWLPDAMAGPTPVSALIHAATMVTAGVYMIARMSFIFIATPFTLTVISIVAALTAFVAATIAITQNDIKKVLAYSTVSQLGYMFLAIGSGAFTAGVFHVMTHAFFKALLFLGAGSVILSAHHEQNILLMGGLRKKIPVTFITFFIGTLAIAGIPGLSGFFSKDEILWKVYSTPNEFFPELPLFLWLTGLITAGITSFYMFRLLFLTFFGKFRGDDEEAYEEVHESPLTMTIPLMILAVLSAVSGYIGLPESLGGQNLIHKWLAPVLALKEEPVVNHEMESHLMNLSILVSFAGAFMAYVLYILKPATPGVIAKTFAPIYKLLYGKYFVDEIYEAVIVAPLLKIRLMLNTFDHKIIDAFVNLTAVVTKAISRLHGIFDRVFVDGAVNNVATFTQYQAGIMRNLQNGSMNRYLYYIVGSFIMIYVFIRIL
ncbi:MAG: NADH-quinone oxidoreductase subunit L [Spirochaetia bacterium]|nr:NADH-quinone oxidoreductase subunit L [Spirochaetia bacterium]